MSELYRLSHTARQRRARRGQTLIVALAVLFIMLFIGGFFVTQIARNLTASGRSRDTQDADALAKAGIEYCNERLNNSLEGADWRPTPTTPTNNVDPDYFWLERGFARVGFPGGRALVRVAYDPNPYNPVGQALRIEAVGRTGELPVGGSDPTVFVPNNQSPRLRRELLAYKRIGLTDFGEFVTAKNRTTQPAYIGTPPIGHNVSTLLGDPQLGNASNPNYARGLSEDGQHVLYGFPIYCGTDLTLGGDTYLYESPRGAPSGVQFEQVQVNGSITLDPTHTRRLYAQPGSVDDTIFPAYLNEDSSQPPVLQASSTAGAVLPSAAGANFNTYKGLIRDGGPNAAQSDVNGYTRAIPHLDPPLIDTAANGTGITRYRALTRESGYWYSVLEGGQQVQANTGEYGYGTGIYINNTGDLQKETTTPGINGGYSERADWLNPGAGYSQSAWQGPFYRPPGLEVQLLGNIIRLRRSDGKSFYNSDLTSNGQNGGTTIDIPLTDKDRKQIQLPNGATLQVLPHDGDDPSNSARSFGDPHSYGVSVVLYAEGNIRVRGIYGAITNVNDIDESGNARKLGRVHLTLVSAGTAYIDGNVVRGDGYIDNTSTLHMERASTCAILAKDYVCINTTMFMQPANQTNVWSRITPDVNAFAEELGLTQTSSDFTFSWGVDPGSYTTNGQASEHFLMVRHGALGATATQALINILINPALAANNLSALMQFQFNSVIDGSTGKPTTYFVSQSNAAISFEGVGLDLDGTQTFAPIATPGVDNTLRFQLDQTLQGINSGATYNATDDYLLSAVTVAPLDIRVEACLYAQEKSFFVIPGYSFNPDATDSRAAYAVRNAGNNVNLRISYDTADILDVTSDPTGVNRGLPQWNSRFAKDVFPFYNEPNDVRITVFGSIAENYTATAGDQAAWLAKWGFVPAYYGSTYNYAQPLAVPDDHLKVHDQIQIADKVLQDLTLDFRTPLESQAGNFNLPPNAQDIPITNGLRTLYDPTFAMPYLNPTDVTLGGTDVASALLRKQRALRSIITPISPTGGVPYTIVQVLPPIPRLPVCPNYVYAGETDRLIGSDNTDTDNINDL